MVNLLLILICAFVAGLIHRQFVRFYSNVIVAIYEMMQPNMIFARIGRWLEAKLGTYWSKPFGLCPACMASVYFMIPMIITFGILSLYINGPVFILGTVYSIFTAFQVSYTANNLAIDLHKERNQVVLSFHERKEKGLN